MIDAYNTYEKPFSHSKDHHGFVANGDLVVRCPDCYANCKIKGERLFFGLVTRAEFEALPDH